MTMDLVVCIPAAAAVVCDLLGGMVTNFVVMGLMARIVVVFVEFVDDLRGEVVMEDDMDDAGGDVIDDSKGEVDVGEEMSGRMLGDEGAEEDSANLPASVSVKVCRPEVSIKEGEPVSSGKRVIPWASNNFIASS